MCSVAGALLANLAQFVSPSYMHWARSAEMLLMVLLGGMGSVAGPVHRRRHAAGYWEGGGCSSGTHRMLADHSRTLAAAGRAFRGGIDGLLGKVRHAT